MQGGGGGGNVLQIFLMKLQQFCNKFSGFGGIIEYPVSLLNIQKWGKVFFYPSLYSGRRTTEPAKAPQQATM